jgi:hypothetical protein
MECLDNKNTKVLDNNKVEVLYTLPESNGIYSVVLIMKIGLQAVILKFKEIMILVGLVRRNKVGLTSIFIVILFLLLSSLWSSSTSYLKIG